MTTRMRLLVFLVLLSMQQYSLAQATDAEAQPDSGDRELKTNEEGYDFFSIDQLFMNNPQYAKLLSDLQAHSFGSNWRRKRDVEDAAEGAQVEEQDARREDDIDEQPMPDVAAESREETATTAAIAEITEVVRDTKETQETQEAEGRTTPVKTASPSSTTAALSSAAAVPSSTTAAGSFGFSGSTEATHGRPEEPTTSASPIRSSTPRRLLHKGGSKNKNKQGSANKNNQNKQQDSVTAQNVNKFTVTNTPSYTAVPPNSPSPSSSSSSSTPSQVTASVSPNSQATSSSSSSSSSPANSNMADATAAVAATTANATAGNKDKVGLAPTKYHYYPHNQHIYFLPECAIQQVCNAVYVRLNYTQPLCACPPRYRDPCSASLNEDDNHTIKLVGNAQRKAITLAKTCENTNELRECRAPKDWSILALQNSRTGKSHYLVICKCPPHFRLEGPLAHDQPTYAGLPGINVYGMLCVPPESYAPKPALKPAHPQQHIYNKWKVRPSTVSSYRSFQNVTQAEDYE